MDLSPFERQLTPEERQLWESLDSPPAIQAFLDSVQYPSESINRNPLRVLRERRAHCLDGGLFAALALSRLGYPPQIVDILPEPGTDDDHVIAIFRRDGALGAVAKSNYVGLRYREAVYRSLRELIMSYFESYYSVEGQRTLRYYTRPINLAAYARVGWMWRDEGVDWIEKRLLKAHHYPILTEAMIAHLSPVDRRSYEAGMLGVNPEGLFRRETPKEASHEGSR